MSSKNPSLRSKRFRASSSRTSGREQKKKKGMTGEGEGKEGTACPQTPRFWKTAFAHERSFWLVRCWWCWLLSTRNINQTRNALFTSITDLVSSDLEIEQWRLRKANLMGMTACGSDWKKANGLFVGDNINVNQNISTQHWLKPP